MIAEKFPVTLTLGLLAIALAIIVGIPLGIISALKRNSWLDYSTSFVSMLGQAIPSYLVGILFILFFAATLHIFPTSGWGTPKEMVLPVLTLSLLPMSTIARFTRVSLLDTLNQDYIRTAYAKGGTDQVVISRHALKNSLIPITTIIGPQLAFILAGSAVFVENIFRVPGVGQLFVYAAGYRDYPLIVTSTFVLALAVMILNLIVDILYSIIDPRIKLK